MLTKSYMRRYLIVKRRLKNSSVKILPSFIEKNRLFIDDFNAYFQPTRNFPPFV